MTIADLVELRNADLHTKIALQGLRRAGASKAADAVARARKSVGGALRHAQRCVDASRQS